MSASSRSGKRYGFTLDDLAKIEAKYLNAWREYDAAQWRADGEREKYRAKAEQLGLDAASIWLDFDCDIDTKVYVLAK